MACNQCFCLACVRTNTVALVERCGKFQAIKGPGCQCLVWPVDSIVGRVSLRVRQLDVNCETKTKDNVFVNVVISVQYQVVLEKAFDAFYKLANPEIQIQAYVFDVVRSELPKMELDESFSNKEQLANEVKHHLDETMMSFGYSIIKALVTDISPDARVKICVEIKILRRARAESSRRPPRHRRDACAMAWRCRFLTARPSQDSRVIAEKRLSEELSVHPTHWLISTQRATMKPGSPSPHATRNSWLARSTDRTTFASVCGAWARPM